MFIDLFVVLLIAVFFVIGVVQGFIVSLLIFAAWVVGFLSVWLFSEKFSSMLGSNIESLSPFLASCFGTILAFLIPFLLIRIIVFAVNSFMKKSSSLSALNRFLGGIIGALKGIAAAVIILTAIHLVSERFNLQQTVEKSTAYSIYRSLPFADIWNEFKTEPEELRMEI